MSARGPRKAGPTALPTMNIDWPSVMTWVLAGNCAWIRNSAETYVVEVRVTKIWSKQYIVTMDHFFHSGQWMG